MASALPDFILLEVVAFLDLPTLLSLRRSYSHIRNLMNTYEVSIVKDFDAKHFRHPGAPKSAIPRPESYKELPRFEKAHRCAVLEVESRVCLEARPYGDLQNASSISTCQVDMWERGFLISQILTNIAETENIKVRSKIHRDAKSGRFVSHHRVLQKQLLTRWLAFMGTLTSEDLEGWWHVRNSLECAMHDLQLVCRSTRPLSNLSRDEELQWLMGWSMRQDVGLIQRALSTQLNASALEPIDMETRIAQKARTRKELLLEVSTFKEFEEQTIQWSRIQWEAAESQFG